MKFYLAVLFIIFLSLDINGQNEVSSEVYNSLQGKWVKTSGEKDTLEFKWNSEKMFILTKQFGSKPLQDPEGIYTFNVKPEGIYLHWLPSATMFLNKSAYFFKLDTLNRTLIIGNFYAHPKDIQLLYFKKVTNTSSIK